MITETLQLSRKQILLSSVLATIVLGTTPIQMQAEIIPMNVVQQNQALKGQVLDNNGDPIIGATVKVEGTKMLPLPTWMVILPLTMLRAKNYRCLTSATKIKLLISTTAATSRLPCMKTTRL